MSCGHQGPHFGARYPDAACIDGYLRELDSCDEPGCPLFSGGDARCPCCNAREYVECGDNAITGNAHQRRTKRRSLIRAVNAWATRA